MISRKNKYIFIHVPKTGGSSIEKRLLEIEGHGSAKLIKPERWAFLNYLPRHLKIEYQLGHGWHHKKYSEYPEKARKSYFSFAFVRNPWDVVVSEYHWHKKWKHVLEKQTRLKFPDFSTFVEYPERYSFPDHGVLQSDFLDGGVDFIGRFENFDADWLHVCEVAGFPPETLQKLNKSKNRENYREMYNEKTRNIIAERHLKDITRFRYEFG